MGIGVLVDVCEVRECNLCFYPPKLWAENGSVAPLKLMRTLQKIEPRFEGYQQHDAQELLNVLLDGLHEDLNR